jgi:predicted nucleic acid-binding protein
VNRTFVDASMLIAGIRGQPDQIERVIATLDDAQREFLSSNFVRLEVLPKALFHGQDDEVTFYEQFFRNVVEYADISTELVNSAFTLASRWNLNAVDALHVASALQLGADELITTERPTPPLSRVNEPGLTIVSIREGPPEA